MKHRIFSFFCVILVLAFLLSQVSFDVQSDSQVIFDDFSGDTPGSIPTGWFTRGSAQITPTVIEVGGTGPNYRLVSFPEVGWQYWDEWLIKNGPILSKAYTVETKMQFRNVIADRAGITIAWNDTNWNRIDIQPNIYGNDIEFRLTYTGANPSNVVVQTLSSISINAYTDYWLKVVANDLGPGNGIVDVYWSSDHVHYAYVLHATGLPDLTGMAGLSTAGPHMPNTYFDDFSATSNSTGDISLNVPRLMQNDTPWGNLEYDHMKATIPNYPAGTISCGTTIGDCGCALTSMTMLLQYYGVLKDPSGRPTTPETLNNYFNLTKEGQPFDPNDKNNQTKCSVVINGTKKYYTGYVSRGFSCEGVIWSAVDQFSMDARTQNTLNGNPGPVIQFVPDPKNNNAYDEQTFRNDISNINTIKNFNKGSPVILYKSDAGHFFVADGISGNTFHIEDPAFSNRTDLQSYGNTADKMFRYRLTDPDLSALVVPIEPPEQILITDPNGKRVGFDSITSSLVQEIPNSTYFQNGPIMNDSQVNTLPPNVYQHMAVIENPIQGNYTIQVVPPIDTFYSFNVYAYDINGKVMFYSFVGQPPQGNTSTFNFTYNPTPNEQTLSLQVPVDIKPGDSTNPINLKSNGVTPVAILSNATFDATNVDPLSVKFGPGQSTSTQNSLEDVNGDGKPDLVLHFRTQQAGITKGSTQACLTGNTKNGLSIKGCDLIKIVP